MRPLSPSRRAHRAAWLALSFAALIGTDVLAQAPGAPVEAAPPGAPATEPPPPAAPMPAAEQPEAAAPEVASPDVAPPEATPPKADAPPPPAPEPVKIDPPAPEPVKAEAPTSGDAEAPKAEPPDETKEAEAPEETEEAEEEPPPPPPLEVAKYREEESPLVFRVHAGGKDPRTRAKEASEALSAALDRAEDDERPRAVTVRIEDGVAVVRIGEYLVTTMYDVDADAEGMSLENYAERLEGQLRAFVSAQLGRKAIQLFFLHVFLSVFFGVLGFLTLRFLRTAFDRWDETLDEKRGSLQPISILRIPVISGEALGGTLAFGLAVGRVTAYVATVIATVAAILGQFDFTRPLLHRLVGWSAGPILRGIEAVVSAIPGLILAAVLFVGARAGLRVLNLLLDGVASKRIVWKRLPPPRVPVFRVVASAAVVLVMGPLLVAAAFGRFGTPLEHLALGVGGVVLLASTPTLASYAVGVVVLWRDSLRPGDWVQVGNLSGEVTRISLGEVSLVPEGGGTIGVPMLYLLFHPLRRLREPPAVCFDVTVARDRPARDLIDALRAAVVAAEPDARVECVDICHAWLKLRVSAPAVRDGVRQQLLIAVSDAVDRHEFELPTLHGLARDEGER